MHAHFKLSGEAIEQKIFLKYQGVTLDNQLKWKDHISLVSLKVYRAIGMIQYAKKVLLTKFIENFIFEAS